jgi:hypothetical protein
MQEDFPVTTDAGMRQTGSKLPQSRAKRFRLLLLIIVLFVIVVSMFVFGRSVFAPPALQPGDLLLLAPESIARVEAVAKSGDIVAQSFLGSAYLQGKGDLPKDMTKAVYWLRKVADRDPSQFDRISSRMDSLLEKRRQELEPRKRLKMDLEYLDLVAKELAFESAILGLIDVYLGRDGTFYSDARLAVKYMRLGAAYGFPSAQRALGIVTQFGLFGVPRDEIAGTILVSEAAANGDQIAQQLLLELRAYDHAMLHARMGTAFSEHSLW